MLLPLASAYNCTQGALAGCWFEESQLFDDNCDCAECEDEMFWTCANCGCPTECGESVPCNTEGYNCMLSTCTISGSYVNDDWCDCPECDDEDVWDCETCGDCPTECGEHVECGIECNDNCSIPYSKVNDGFCDCSECEDESLWTCETCAGCPSQCGLSVQCSDAPSTTDALGFVCDDGCNINDDYVDDNWCDCTQCEDEPNWTCDSCPGCPPTCGGAIYCVGTTVAPITTEWPTTEGPTTTTTEIHTTTETPTTTTESQGFTCDDGCVIVEKYFDDDWCDCSQCEDEPNWDCDSCAGGCPTQCGAYEYCIDTDTTTTQMPTTTESLPTTPAPTCERTNQKQKSYTYSSDAANCFSSIDEQLPGNGWTQAIGPLSVGQSVVLYTVSGVADDCQLAAARCDGIVTVTRRVDAVTGDWLQVAFAGNEANGVRFTKYFVWFGTSQLPLKNNGQFTVNKNAFFCKAQTPGSGSVNFELQCQAPDAEFSFDDSFYFIAHALAVGCDPTGAGQRFCDGVFD